MSRPEHLAQVAKTSDPKKRPPGPLTFFTLPGEARNLVYGEYFRNFVINLTGSGTGNRSHRSTSYPNRYGDKPAPERDPDQMWVRLGSLDPSKSVEAKGHAYPLLASSKQLHQEAWSVMYTKIHVAFTTDFLLAKCFYLDTLLPSRAETVLNAKSTHPVSPFKLLTSIQIVVGHECNLFYDYHITNWVQENKEKLEQVSTILAHELPSLRRLVVSVTQDILLKGTGWPHTFMIKLLWPIRRLDRLYLNVTECSGFEIDPLYKERRSIMFAAFEVILKRHCQNTLTPYDVEHEISILGDCHDFILPYLDGKLGKLRKAVYRHMIDYLNMLPDTDELTSRLVTEAEYNDSENSEVEEEGEEVDESEDDDEEAYVEDEDDAEDLKRYAKEWNHDEDTNFYGTYDSDDHIDGTEDDQNAGVDDEAYFGDEDCY